MARARRIWSPTRSGLSTAGLVDAVVGWHHSSIRQAVAARIGGAIPYVYTALYEGGEVTPGVFLIGETPAFQLRPAVKWLRNEHGVRRWCSRERLRLASGHNEGRPHLRSVVRWPAGQRDLRPPRHVGLQHGAPAGTGFGRRRRSDAAHVNRALAAAGTGQVDAAPQHAHRREHTPRQRSGGHARDLPRLRTSRRWRRRRASTSAHATNGASALTPPSSTVSANHASRGSCCSRRWRSARAVSI